MLITVSGKNNTFSQAFSAEETFHIPKKILEKSGGLLRFSFSVPVKEICSLWHPDLSAMPQMRLPWSEKFSCGATKSFPLLVFLDQDSLCSCAFGLTDLIDDCTLTAKMNQEACCYEVEIISAIDKETESFDFFLHTGDSSGKKLSLPELLASYRKCLPFSIPSYPEGAWKSVYCSWYAVHAALTDSYMQKNAEEAARLGFGTFIVDDGWCFEEAKRVTPETLSDWYRDIGDWQYSEKKLPLLKETIHKKYKNTLSWLFWVAPFFSGRRSKLDTCIREYLTPLHEGQRIYDIADLSVTEKVMESIYETYKDLDLDGLKIDFIDMIAPDPEKPRCRIAYSCIKTLVEKLKKHKKDALIEFRQKYATPLMASLATAFRAGDVPFDYMENFSRCVQIRLLMGDKIPVHADPVYFNREESVETAGRHMIAALAGVPMVSMELTLLKEEHKKVIANYLAFYKKNQHILNMGHWEMRFCNNFPVILSCTLEKEKIILLAEKSFFKESLKNHTGKVTILNMSMASLPLPFSGAEIFDAQGNFLEEVAFLPSGGRVVMDAPQNIM